jgi:ribonuclease HII
MSATRRLTMTTARRPRSRPDLTYEAAAEAKAGPGTLVCGIDEAGRGPLAGPVTAAAVILVPDLPPDLVAHINDSKLLSRHQRERVEPEIRRHALAVGVGHAGVEEIDALNILQATLLAMKRAFEAMGTRPGSALVDGRFAPPLPCLVTTVVRGDGLSLSIAAASVIAKVARDRIMDDLALRHPEFGWAHNAGYPTAEHREALRRHGPTPHHRKTFAPVARLLART